MAVYRELTPDGDLIRDKSWFYPISKLIFIECTCRLSLPPGFFYGTKNKWEEVGLTHKRTYKCPKCKTIHLIDEWEWLPGGITRSCEIIDTNLYTNKKMIEDQDRKLQDHCRIQ